MTFDPVAASALGFVQTMQQEFVQLRGRLVDLPLDHPAANAKRLSDGLLSSDRESLTRWDGEQRWVNRYQTLDASLEPEQAAGFEEGGTYLVTGGLGGIGYELSMYLASRYDARLLLVGRSDESEKRKPLAHLRATGADVQYIQADVADRDALLRGLEQCSGDWRQDLTGILHLAGTYREYPCTELNADKALDEARAKVVGSWALHAIAEQCPSEPLFVVFSSVNGFFGGMNVGAYSAENSFVEAFVRCVGARMRSYAVAFSMWHDIGMSAGNPAAALSARRGYQLISATRGLHALEAVLRQPPGEYTVGLDAENPALAPHFIGGEVARVQLSAFANHAKIGNWVRNHEDTDKLGVVNPRYLETLPELEGGDIDIEALRRMEGTEGEGRTNEFVEPATQTEETLAALWREVLKVERVGVTDNFFELGGHSLLATQLVARLRERFDADIPLQTLFHCATVRELGEKLDWFVSKVPAMTTGRPLRSSRAMNPCRFHSLNSGCGFWINLSLRVHFTMFSSRSGLRVSFWRMLLLQPESDHLAPSIA